MKLDVGLVAWLGLGLAMIGMSGLVAFATAAIVLHRHKIPPRRDENGQTS
jgi:hypothetical protein